MKSLVLFLGLIIMAGCGGSDDGKKDPADGRFYYSHEKFSMGADLSYVNQILDFGGLYRDSGKVTDPYIIFRKYGANTVRFRLWHNPQWTREVYTPPIASMYNDYNDVKRGIQAAKSRGMAVSLDFHYSDFWADPGRQQLPAAWAGLSLQILRDSIYNYTLKTLDNLETAGIMPEYVQVGNEINPGFLLPQGDRWAKKADFVYLLNGAIKAVRDAAVSSSVKPRIIVHIAQPENAIYWFEGMAAAGLTDYDIAGISYYYIWSTVSIDSVSDYVADIKTLTGKEVMVVETAYPWTLNNADNYNNILATDKLTVAYPANQTGQYNYLVKLTQEIIDGGGIGIHYWEPAWITSEMRDSWGKGSSWDCNTLFDFTGNVIRGMDYMTYPYVFKK
ncbi:MAG: arabinogalactan endo-1,4-beta-galactosidase [Bacteroidales bacterium]|jgi:arabinogalactan endo-1,4-beta-galactosidase|nr:arabinogalactan endo-1,4-beta-galactosidase [Bacteroidales bacterium]